MRNDTEKEAVWVMEGRKPVSWRAIRSINHTSWSTQSTAFYNQSVLMGHDAASIEEDLIQNNSSFRRAFKPETVSTHLSLGLFSSNYHYLFIYLYLDLLPHFPWHVDNQRCSLCPFARPPFINVTLFQGKFQLLSFSDTIDSPLSSLYI